MDYGAVHNNATDDAPAIMRAMLAARAAGGGTVYLPAGTYRLVQGYDLPGTGTTEATWRGVDQSMKANVVVFSNCTLAGAGVGKTVLIPAATDSRNCVGALMQRNIGVHDLSVVSPSAQAATTSKDCYKIMGCTNGSFSNLSGENSYIGVNFSGGQRLHFSNCRMSSCTIGFSGRTATDAASAGGAYYMAIDNVTFTNCEASGASQSGIAYGFAIYEWQATQPSPGISNITLSGCSSHDNDTGGVYTRWVERLTITNSTFNNNGESAVSMANTHNYWLAGNTATGNPNNSLPDNRGDCWARAGL